MHDIQIHDDFRTSFEHFAAKKKRPHMAEVNLAVSFFVILTSFTGSVVERSRTALRERKKIEKNLREKNRWIQGVRADLDEVSELSRPGGALGVERESPAPVINTELWVNCELFLQIWATHAGASPPVSPAGSLHEAASLSLWRRRFFFPLFVFFFFYPRVFFLFYFLSETNGEMGWRHRDIIVCKRKFTCCIAFG